MVGYTRMMLPLLGFEVTRQTKSIDFYFIPGPPKVCRIVALYRFWAIILPTFGGLGNGSL